MPSGIDFDVVEDAFSISSDGTVGIEEEFAILDQDSLDLAPKFELLKSSAAEGSDLAASIAGELVLSEIEIRSGKGRDVHHAQEMQRRNREELFALADSQGLALAATGTHPWANYLDQKIIDTDHYRRVEHDLRWVAWRNTTFSLHVHVGVQGADRAVRVCDRLRVVLPDLLAMSASSPFLDGRDSGLHSIRTQTFTKSFPRCGIPDAYGGWASFRDYLETLLAVNSIVEYTQVWWSVRPHLSFGTVEVRICDAQPTGPESEALAQLIVACVLQAARDEDEGRPFVNPSRALLEENFWRALRFGLDGRLIDFEARREFETSQVRDRLLAWTEPVRSEQSISPEFPERNAAQRQRDLLLEGRTIREVYAQSQLETKTTYAPGALA